MNGLGLVRALSALNLRVIVITTQPYDMAHHSEYVSEHHHVPRLGVEPELLAELLKHHAKDWSGAVVFPTNDEAIACLSLYHDELVPWFRLVMPPLDSVPYVLEKDRMLQAAGSVGMSLPYSYGAAGESLASNPGLRYPVVVKSVKAGEFSSKLAKKLFVARDPSDLLWCTRLLAREGLAGEVFDVIPGPDSHIHAYCVYMDRHGEPLAECTIRKLRQSPPSFGVARAAELTDNIALLREQSIELLRRIGFRGIAVGEFKLDERDGSFRFLEINGRSVIYNTLLRRGNLDVVRLAWSDYVEGQARRVETVRWPGVWIHLHADVLRSLQNWRSEQLTLRDYIKPYGRKKTFAVWSSIDPKPFFMQWSRTFREATSIVFG